MFVGHYAPAFAAKAARPAPSLGAAMIAVQLLDFGWAGLILAGVERGRIEPGFLALSPLRLDYMPYTHSLPAALLWALGAALVYRMLDRRAGWVGAALIGACVFSHWILDVLVHAADMPLWGDSAKIGFSLWDNIPVGVALELGGCAAGVALYVSATQPKGLWGRIGPWFLLAVLIASSVYNWTAAPPARIEEVATSGLIAYPLLAGFGFLVDFARAPKTR